MVRGGIQLQRIVSRCKADLLIRYGDTEVGSEESGRNIILSLGDAGGWSDQSIIISSLGDDGGWSD